MSQTLLDNIYSPEDLSELIADLKRYAKWLTAYTVKQRVSTAPPTTQTPTVAPAALKYLNELHARHNLTQESIAKLIADLQAIAVVAPRISFTFAAAPSNGLKKAFVTWCRQNISHDILVSFQFNATILGGMVVRHGSHIYDWSFKRQILAERTKFPEALRHV